MQRPLASLHARLLLFCLAWATLYSAVAAAADATHEPTARPDPGARSPHPHMNPEVVRYWNAALPSSAMPDAITKLVSPLSTLQVKSYRQSLKLGRLAADPRTASAFCASAHLTCGSLTSLAGTKLDSMASAGTADHDDDDDMRSSSWFLEEHLFAGTRTAEQEQEQEHAPVPMSVPAGRFSDRLQQATGGSFLPRELAAFFRLFQRELQNILNQFHVPETSFLGDAMRNTVRFCIGNTARRNSPQQQQQAGPESRGACVTSLEDMVDLVGTLLRGSGGGRSGPGPTSVEAVSSSSYPASDAALAGGRFRVVRVEEKADERGWYVACRSLMFPFQVAYCHRAAMTKLYSVTLESTAVPGVAVTNLVLCHMDTSAWSPDHVAFKVLGKGPGQTEACHWSAPDALAFVLPAAK